MGLTGYHLTGAVWAPIQKYSPGQPRDQKGRWTDGAAVGIGSKAPGVGTPSHTVVEAVKTLPHYDHTIPNDDDITQADAYESMVHAAGDPRVAASYAALEDTLMMQWNHLAAEGFTYEPQGDAPDYHGSEEVINALNGKHLRVYLTEGGADMPGDHPMMKPVSGVKGLGERPVLNDVFRAVHDTIGHGVSGGTFGVKGERAAWIAHRATFPKEALPALWNETRGQAAWTNAGPPVRVTDVMGRTFVPKRGEPGYIALPDRPFADQKAGFGPDFGASV